MSDPASLRAQAREKERQAEALALHKRSLRIAQQAIVESLNPLCERMKAIDEEQERLLEEAADLRRLANRNAADERRFGR